MTKLLKIFISGLLVFISINSLYAFEIPFISGGSEKIILATNDMDVRYNYLMGNVGSYELFSVEGKNGFRVRFAIVDNILISTNTLIYYHAIFSNELLNKEMALYEALSTTNEKLKDNKMLQVVAMLEFVDKFSCNVYINNQNITKRINDSNFIPDTYFDMKETIFNNELVFKDGNNQTYKLKLDDKYKDIIHKKIMLYQKKKEQLRKEYENR